MDKDTNRLNELFNQARHEAPKVSFEETQKRFLSDVEGLNPSSSLKRNWIKQLLTVKNLIIMILTLSTVIIGAVLLTNTNNTIIENKTPLTIKDNIKSDSALIIEEHEKVMQAYLNKVAPLKMNFTKELHENKKLLSVKTPLATKKVKSTIQNQIIEEDTSYRFPSLTMEQIKTTKKQKYKMLRELARYNRMPALNNIDGRKYPMVYWNPLVKTGKVSSINASGAFHIQKTEVSNLEYRTFLFDLLLQGRKQEFLVAKPDQEMWNKEFEDAHNDPMVENYFSHPAYNDYPAVGMTREGAELYCKWLTEERNKLNPEKYGKLVNKVRLPTDKEWIQAASDGGKHLPYPWGGPYIRNSEGIHLANFKPKRPESYRKEGEEFYEFCYICDGAFHTAKVTSYNPNAYGLYCMAGNVAEMVYYKDENMLPGTKGGSWTSIGQELQIIDGKDRFKGIITPSVNVGFRPVITYLGYGKPKADTTFRFPNLTTTEIKENNKLKERYVKLNSKQELFGYLTIPAGEVNLNGKNIVSTKFEMKQTEVSNLQYRVFLFDLLIHDRKTDFLIAKPGQQQWEKLTDEYGKYLAKNYFSGAHFNDYPVVNISRAGAEMYCQWLSDEINKTQGKRLKGKKAVVKLPTEEEWMFAASGGKNNPYGWNTLKTRQNSSGCFMGNFKYSPKIDTISFTGCQIKYVAVQTTSGLMLGKTSLTVKINSYNPNSFDLYCISGNVAEMVVSKNNIPNAKGGSWQSTGENIKITATNEFKGVTTPNVNIGFRPILILK